MKLTYENILSLKAQTTNKLMIYAINYVLNEWGNCENKEAIINDVLTYGANNGQIDDLCYYDTSAIFFEKYKNEINEIIINAFNLTGDRSFSKLFHDRDNSDPLFLDDYNKYILSCFGVEESLYNLKNYFEEAEEEEEEEEETN